MDESSAILKPEQIERLFMEHVFDEDPEDAVEICDGILKVIEDD